jgi:Uncharacterized protein conserved in bacteria (DUF2188)
MAPNRTVYHVVPDTSRERWLVTEENAEFREEFRTKSEAVAAAKHYARSHELSQVKVHRGDGKIEYESTYANDPKRTPD